MRAAKTRTMKILRELVVVIPDGMSFLDLRLKPIGESAMRLDFEVLRKVWAASGYAPDLLNEAGTAEIAEFVVRFFAAFVKAGGFVDIETAGLVGLLRDETRAGRKIVPY